MFRIVRQHSETAKPTWLRFELVLHQILSRSLCQGFALRWKRWYELNWRSMIAALRVIICHMTLRDLIRYWRNPSGKLLYMNCKTPAFVSSNYAKKTWPRYLFNWDRSRISLGSNTGSDQRSLFWRLLRGLYYECSQRRTRQLQHHAANERIHAFQSRCRLCFGR